jgi:hypothetical protein
VDKLENDVASLSAFRALCAPAARAAARRVLSQRFRHSFAELSRDFAQRLAKLFVREFGVNFPGRNSQSQRYRQSM